jgi:RNA polymerase sigma-70 factor (ECF subfamily)
MKARNGITTAIEAERFRDAGLIERMAAGDQDALAEFYDRYSSTLYGVAMKILNDHPEADAALEKTFVKLWRDAGTYQRRHGSPFAWAVMTVRNEAIERLRRREGDQHASGRNGTNGALSGISDEPALWELRTRAGTALARLPKEHRDALEMMFFGGFTFSEAANRLGVPEGVVNMRLRRGLVLMRKLMSARYD